MLVLRHMTNMQKAVLKVLQHPTSDLLRDEETVTELETYWADKECDTKQNVLVASNHSPALTDGLPCSKPPR